MILQWVKILLSGNRLIIRTQYSHNLYNIYTISQYEYKCVHSIMYNICLPTDCTVCYQYYRYMLYELKTKPYFESLIDGRWRTTPLCFLATLSDGQAFQ